MLKQLTVLCHLVRRISVYWVGCAWVPWRRNKLTKGYSGKLTGVRCHDVLGQRYFYESTCSVS